MNNIPNAEQSPRIVNGVLRWYEHDTFDIQLELTLTDQDGEAIEIQNDDTVAVVFRDKSENVTKEFEFTGITGNTVTLDFDAECSALFERGPYTYDVLFTSNDRTTLASRNKVVVE